VQIPGQLSALMEALEALYQANLNVRPPDGGMLSYTRWRPVTPSAPYYYHQLNSSPFAIKDQSRWQDTINLTLRCGRAHTDEAETMELVTGYADFWRDVLDPEFAKVGLPGTTVLDGTVNRAERSNMAIVPDTFSGTGYLAVEFNLSFDLWRRPLEDALP
jgi:hypothetical protein